MRTMFAIFQKQLADVLKNPTVTMNFVLFPLLAFVMSTFMSPEDLESRFIMIAPIAAMAVAQLPMLAMAMYISEDIETKSLRFLIMAGVKPIQYLLGISLFTFILSIIAMGSFALMLMGELTGEHLLLFTGISALGLLASLAIGAMLGIISKNVQQGMTLGTVVSMALAFTPVIAMANPDIMRVTYFMFSQQVANIFNYIALNSELGSSAEAVESFYEAFGIEFSFTNSLLIIVANFVVFAILFLVVYKKRGLRLE